MKPLVLYARALTAAATLTGMVFGVPLVLAAVVGNPLPDLDALRVGDLSDDTLLHLGATIAWLVWAYLVLLLVLEARVQVNHRPNVASPGPGPGQQRFFQPLVAAFLLSAPTVAATIGAAGAPVHPPQPPTGMSAAEPGTRTFQQGTSTVQNWRPAPVSLHTAGDQVASSSLPGSSSSSPREIFLMGMGAGTGLSLIASTFHLVIRRRRQRYSADRRPGYLAALTPAGLVATERSLKSGAEMAADVRYQLNMLLAKLDAALIARGRGPVDVLAVRLGYDSFDLVVASTVHEALPKPWRRDPDSGCWSLPSAYWSHDTPTSLAAGPVPVQRRWSWIGQTASPAAANEEASDVWLLNLSVAPSIRVIAPNPAGTDIVRAMVLSLDLAEIRDLDVDVRSSADELLRLREVAGEVGDGRRGASWTLRIVDRIRPSAVRRSSGESPATALILTDDLGSVKPDEVRLVLDVTGSLHTSFTPGVISPARFTEDDLERLRPMLHAATAPATRLPPALPRPPSPSGKVPPPINVIGLPILDPDPEPLDENSAEVARQQDDLRPTDAGDGRSLLGRHRLQEVTARSGVEAEDVLALIPRLSSTQRVPYQDDPDLDAELELWNDPNCPRPRLRILGAIEVFATGRPPSGGRRKPWWHELVVLLYAHPEGLTAEQFTEFIWPHDLHAKLESGVPRQNLSNIRKWMGVDPDTGRHFVPEARSLGNRGIYRIDGLICDADLARRLRARGVSRGSEGLRDLQTALDLVTGPILHGRRDKGYDWLIERPIQTDILAMVVEIAHTLATHWLTCGEPEKAEAAALQADLAGSFDDITRLDLIAAARARGSEADEELWLQRLIDTHGVDGEEELPSWTFDRLERVRGPAHRTRP